MSTIRWGIVDCGDVTEFLIANPAHVQQPLVQAVVDGPQYWCSRGADQLGDAPGPERVPCLSAIGRRPTPL
jgi:hypothetical protein